MTFKVPKFQNGQILSEQQLYSLPRLSIECFRWNSVAGKNFGFFAPPGNNLGSVSNPLNQFDWEDNNLFINNLFVISSQGYPFIIRGRKKIEVVGTTLFAVAYLAEDSESYSDDGYRVDFKWDVPEIESNDETEPFLIELGKLTDDYNSQQFVITPPILQLNGTSKLWETVLKLEQNLDKYIEQLIVAVGENNLDCSEYIERLERLNSFYQKTEVNTFINTALLTLKSAEGFYHRLIYHQDINALQNKYQCCENLRGRALEKRLAKINGSQIEPKIFAPINELVEMVVETGQQQQNFIEKLAYLFSSISYLFKKLQNTGQEIYLSEGYPQTFDVRRWLYQYELQSIAKENSSLVIEFNQQPTNVAFVFTNERNLQSTQTLIPLKVESQQKITNKQRYEFPSFSENYLFVAAPERIIKKVELIKN